MIKKPVRIVYLIGQLGLGGSERQLYLLLKHMDGKKFERHVVVFNPSSNYTLDEDLRKSGVVVHTFPLQLISIYRRMFWLYQLLRKVRPHVIHSWSIHNNAYAGFVGLLAGVPRRLGSVRGSLTLLDSQKVSRLARWLILHSVQGHLVNSKPIADELSAAGISIKRIHVLPNSVEIDPPQELTPLNTAPPHGRLVGMVANFRQMKNHLLFIRGMAIVLPEFQDVFGVIVGQPVLESDPQLPALIESEIEIQGLKERIFMDGFHSNVPSILPRFEIFCLTSNSEGTPNVILEAMAAGLPVIATRVGGIPHIVQDGVTGLLIKPEDINGLVAALRDLLSQPQKARQMGAAGRMRIEKEFSCETIVKAFEEYYLSKFVS